MDILYNPDYDVLNPLFLSMVLWIFYERLLKVLHLGQPCSSFSMAVNSFKTYALRSAKYPEVFEELPPHREGRGVCGKHWLILLEY